MTAARPIGTHYEYVQAVRSGDHEAVTAWMAASIVTCSSCGQAVRRVDRSRLTRSGLQHLACAVTSQRDAV